MKHYGDITKLNGAGLPIVDIITGGSPCQDLSVAGKRAGLAGERSGLFMEQIRVIKEMRKHDRQQRAIAGADDDIRLVRPRYLVWENVPGALSSPGGDKKGQDFRCVLEEICRVADKTAVIPGPPKGGWSSSGCIMGSGEYGIYSVAWRVHDAQFWGVPQRRKRIALVADFGGQTAPEILFERQGVSRDIAQGGKEGERTSGDAERCAGASGTEPIVLESNQNHATIQTNGISTALPASAGMGGGYVPMVCLNDQGGQQMGVSENVTGALRAQEHGHQPIVFEPGAASRVGGHVYDDDVAGTVRANAGDNQQAVVYGISSYDSNAMKSSNPNSGIYEAETARTLDLNGGSPACNQGGMAVVYRKQGHPQNTEQGQGWEPTEVNDTLNAFDSGEMRTPTVVLENHPADSRVKIAEDGIVQTLSSRMGTGGGNVPMVMESKAVESHAQDARYNVGQINQPLSANMEHDPANGGLVVQSMETFHCTNEQDKVQTLKARDYKDPQIVAYGLDRASYNQGANAKFGFCIDEEKVGAQTAKGPGAVCQSVVRRLTPMECERLQGFPTIRKVRFTEMTKDEYIAYNINEGNIVVDAENGKVFATRGPGGVKLDKPRELKGSNLNGYLVVSIRNGETKMQCRVHRIVWIAERGVFPDGYVIDHINNDKQDNRLCNLQLLTTAENSTKAKIDGLYKIHGESGSAKITDEVHDFIQYVYGNTDLSIRQLSEIFGISKSRVHQIIHDEAWTDIGEWIDSKGKKHKDADSPRYKALGNSIALPFWEWMAGRMVKYIDHKPTMASLFDGIGGFPLVFSRAGCEPVWASEIEEFPIAVTKIRFPEDAEA